MENSLLNKVTIGIKALDSSEKKVRDTNLELFRIIVMILIIAHHYVVNSGLTAVDGAMYANPFSLRSIFLFVFGAWGKIGINCFVLITGYFMCKSRITPKKFFKLLGEIMFYRIVINVIFWAVGYSKFSINAFMKMFIPITNIKTGFSSAFLVFFLFIPFLNILLKGMTEKTHIRLLLLSLFLYVFLGTVPGFSVTMNYVSWFIVLYFIAAYVRKYPKRIFFNIKLWGIVTSLSIMLCVASVVLCARYGYSIAGRKAFSFVTDSNTFLAVLTAFSAFMFFKNVKMKNSVIINTIAASSYGVLLIHAHSDTMRQWLWKDLLDNVSMYNSQWLILHAVGSVLLVWLICTVIDHLRIKFIEVPFFQFWDKYWYRVSDKCREMEHKICEKLRIEETEK